MSRLILTMVWAALPASFGKCAGRAHLRLLAFVPRGRIVTMAA